MSNRLAQETSPYLLQHRDNPVDWYPWGEEALARAREEDKPILLSVGYAACHWCHVMERESFEDAETASYMNGNFVNIKVDREERPDVDALYMESVQAITGRGGWPMTVFCDPAGVPFHGGTYFPPQPVGQTPSFRMVLEAVVETFHSRRDEIDRRSPDTAERLGAVGKLRAGEEAPDRSWIELAIEGMMRGADHQNGGFGGAPKFPPASALEFLLTNGKTEFVEMTLDRMLSGGIYDQIGGGFARYSVDATWLVPHFEKMLYDNALLARTYLHGWQRVGHQRYRLAAQETLDWALREMRDESGGFYSSLDADSEGVEGKFYLWTQEQLLSALASAGISAKDAEAVASHYGVTEQGNFEGASVLHRPLGASAAPPDVIDEARTALHEARAQRIWPGSDDKVITSWNALMISALAEAGAVLSDRRYIDAARECAEMILGRLRDDDGRLLRTYRKGDARIDGFLEDSAYMLEALLTLYEATFEPRWYEEAQAVADSMIVRFGDTEGGGFFTTEAGRSDLIARRKDLGDHPIPSGNSAAAAGLIRLYHLSSENSYLSQAEGVLRIYGRIALQNPDAFGHLLQAVDRFLGPMREVALIAPAGTDPDPIEGALSDMARVSWSRLDPALVRAGGTEGAESPAILAGRSASDGSAAAYLCEEFTCAAPTASTDQLAKQLADGA